MKHPLQSCLPNPPYAQSRAARRRSPHPDGFCLLLSPEFLYLGMCCSSISEPYLSSPLPQIFWFQSSMWTRRCLQSYLPDHTDISVGSRSTSQIMSALNIPWYPQECHSSSLLTSVCSGTSRTGTCLPLIWTGTQLHPPPQLHSFLWGLLTLHVSCREHLPCGLGLCVWLPASHSQGHWCRTYPVTSHTGLWSSVNQTRITSLYYSHLLTRPISPHWVVSTRQWAL